jgi:hypothetical protein
MSDRVRTPEPVLEYASTRGLRRRWRGKVALPCLAVIVGGGCWLLLNYLSTRWGIVVVDTGGESCYVSVAGQQYDWDRNSFATLPYGTQMDSITIVPRITADPVYRRRGEVLLNSRTLMAVEPKNPQRSCVMQLTERCWWGIRLTLQWAPAPDAERRAAPEASPGADVTREEKALRE